MTAGDKGVGCKGPGEVICEGETWDKIPTEATESLSKAVLDGTAILDHVASKTDLGTFL